MISDLTMEDVTIRAATLEDCEAMTAIYNHYVEHDTCTYALDRETVAERRAYFLKHDDRHPVVVAERGGTVVGWASVSAWNAKAGYARTVEDSIYIAPDARRRGLGRRLLGVIIDLASAAGHHTMIALVSSEQAGSIALHERAGFVQVGRVTQVGYKFGRWLDCLYLQRFLDRPGG